MKHVTFYTYSDLGFPIKYQNLKREPIFEAQTNRYFVHVENGYVVLDGNDISRYVYVDDGNNGVELLQEEG